MNKIKNIIIYILFIFLIFLFLNFKFFIMSFRIWNGILVKYFSTIKILDDEIEIIRNELCLNRSFCPRRLFDFLDIDQKNFLTLKDLKTYLNNNNIQYEEHFLRKFIHNFDKDGDFSINYDEFLGIILTKKNLNLAKEVINRKYLDEKINNNVENYFNKILIKELNLVKTLWSIAYELKYSKEFTTYESFISIVKDQKYITKENLALYLKENGLNLNSYDTEILMFRIDSDNDGKISYDEFQEIFFPLNRNYSENDIHNNNINYMNNYNNLNEKDNNSNYQIYNNYLKNISANQSNNNYTSLKRVNRTNRFIEENNNSKFNEKKNSNSPLSYDYSINQKNEIPSRINNLNLKKSQCYTPDNYRNTTKYSTSNDYYENSGSSKKKEQTPDSFNNLEGDIDYLNKLRIYTSPVKSHDNNSYQTENNYPYNNVNVIKYSNNNINNSNNDFNINNRNYNNHNNRTIIRCPKEKINNNSIVDSKNNNRSFNNENKKLTNKKKVCCPCYNKNISPCKCYCLIKKQLTILLSLFSDIINQGNIIENAKESLAFCNDANLADLFDFFDYEGMNSISSINFSQALKDLGYYPSINDIKFLFNSCDKNLNEKFDYDEFCDMILPKKYSIAKLISERCPLNNFNGFSNDTKFLIVNVFKCIIEGEQLNEKIRNELNSIRGFSPFDLFNNIKKRFCNVIYKDDLINFLEINNKKFKTFEIKMLIDKLDKDQDGIISYEEFLNEITPKN